MYHLGPQMNDRGKTSMQHKAFLHKQRSKEGAWPDVDRTKARPVLDPVITASSLQADELPPVQSLLWTDTRQLSESLQVFQLCIDVQRGKQLP